jgi:hypothetical protein
MIIKILIIFFLFLITYQIYTEFWNKPNFYSIIEGLENGDQTYKEYDQNDPLILGKQNAGNIEVLRTRIDGIESMKKDVDDMKIQVSGLNDQMTQLVNQQAEQAQELVGSTSPEITGTDSEEPEDPEDPEETTTV